MEAPQEDLLPHIHMTPVLFEVGVTTTFRLPCTVLIAAKTILSVGMITLVSELFAERRLSINDRLNWYYSRWQTSFSKISAVPRSEVSIMVTEALLRRTCHQCSRPIPRSWQMSTCKDPP